MRIACILVTVLCASFTSWAHDVTTPAARKANLLDYIAARSDLSQAEKDGWDKAIRQEFGGAAMRDGGDEGVTVAKSVLSTAIFFAIVPDRAAKAAYEAYHDTFRWVPPPIAVTYQILSLQGRRPKATARQLAFDFPRYFNEEMAVDLANWWEIMLATGLIPDVERSAIETTLRETRDLMRPMLRAKLYQAAQLEARSQRPTHADLGAARDEVASASASLDQEIRRDFAKVGRSSTVHDDKAAFYDRYVALCRELGEPALAKPIYSGPQAPPQPAPHPETSPISTPTPSNEPATAIVEAKVQEGRVPSPLPGDPLLPVFPSWQRALGATVEHWLGTPYRWGGVDHHGIDCSGFSRQVFREAFNVELPRNARAQFATGAKVEQRELRAGDLVFFDTMDRGQVTHVGVFLGNGVFAHASSSSGVTRSELSKPYHLRAYWGAKRILRS